MMKLLIGAAVGALLLPAAPVLAQNFFDDGHDHACVDESCTVFELFQTPQEGATVMGFQGVEAPKYGTWGFDLNGRDTSVNPGDSFFRFANGAALDQMQIPSDRTSYGSFALLRELSDNRVKAMIEALTARTDLAAGSDEQKIADAYRSYMDEARIEALDAQPLQPYLAAIRAADTHEKAAVYMGETQGRIGGSIFGTGISTDQKAPTRYVVSTGQSGLGLPNRDYYLDERFVAKKTLYRAYVERMLEMIGWDNPAANADAILAFESRIAEAHWTPIQNRNRDETYNEYTISQLAAEAPGFPWQDYYNAVGVGEVPRLIVRQDTAMPKIAAIYAETSIEVIQAWQAFHTTDDAASRLSRRFADAQWEFRSRDLNGQPLQRPRDTRCIIFA
jgi:putative endopeptidase